MIGLEKLNISSKSIPSLPLVIQEIINLSEKEENDFQVLIGKLQKDPGLTAQVLALANSSFYGLQNKVSSLREACIVLGVHTLKSIALAAGIINHFPASKLSAVSVDDIWRHSVGTAVAARVLAELTVVEPDLAFTAGLLHDIGKIIINKKARDKYLEVIEYKKHNDCYMLDAEKVVLGITHAEVGEFVAKKWKLPEPICSVIRYHHADFEQAESKLPALIHVADIVSCGLLAEVVEDSMIYPFDSKALEMLSLDIETIGKYLQVIDKMIGVSGSILLAKH
ncbi:MAG: HDOD domain-containing protein [Gammaproteobacteria bacterium]|nr:HDOD domain-containing protein [Gammaproteobacteria bacterium]